MKNVIFSVLIMMIFFSCKKETAMPAPHEKDAYNVLLLSKSGDTTTLPTKWARIQTTGLDSANDGKLRIVLLGYDGNGGYTMEVTNLQNGEVHLDWGWQGVNITSITPVSNMLHANETKTFFLQGEAKIGRIKVKAFGDCGNSSELIINITALILPVVYLDYTVTYDDDLGKTFISFAVEDPTQVNWIVIQKVINKVWKQVAMIPGDDETKKYNIKL